MLIEMSIPPPDIFEGVCIVGWTDSRNVSGQPYCDHNGIPNLSIKYGGSLSQNILTPHFNDTAEFEFPTFSA